MSSARETSLWHRTYCFAVGLPAMDSQTWAVAQSSGTACEGSLQWHLIASFPSQAEAEAYRDAFCPDDPAIDVMPLDLLS